MATGTLSRVCTLTGHEERVWCVAWRPLASPPQLASCGADRVIRLWGQRANSSADSEDAFILLGEIDATDRHQRTLRSLSWSPNGDVMAIASFDATTSIWQETKNRTDDTGGVQFEFVNLVTGHENEVKSAGFSPSGELFATCSRDKSVWIFETAPSFEYECLAVLQSHSQDVKMVRWHPTQDVLFSCSYDDTIKVWGPDGDDWNCKETISGHTSTVWSLCFDSVGSRFVTCSDDCTLRVWAPTQEPLPKSSVQPDAESSQSKEHGADVVHRASYVSPLFRASSMIKTAMSKPKAKPAPKERKAPADAACSWSCWATIEGHHTRPVYAVDWLPFPTANASVSIASAGGDNHVRVFQPQDEESLQGWTCVADVEAHFGDANAVAWCPNPLPGGGALLATGGDDAEVVLWRFDG